MHPTTQQTSALNTFRARVARVAAHLDNRPGLVFAIFSLLYVLMLIPYCWWNLWHDELYTFYIGNAPTFHQFLEDIRHVDLNPPLLYLLSRMSNRLLGPSAFATRLPSMLAFYGFSACLFLYLRRKMGALYAALALLLFCSGLFFNYASEARPYALLLFFFGVTLLTYDSAVTRKPRTRSLFGIAVGCVGMILSHAFAPFYIGPFYFAEFVRTLQRRKLDVPLVATLLVPLAALAIYIPLVSRFQAILFPPRFQASIYTLAHFYYMIPRLSYLALLAAVIGALLLARPVHPSLHAGHWSLTDAALGLAAALSPVLITAAIMRSHGAFWDRYCIGGAVAVYVILVFLLSKWFRDSCTAAFGGFALVALTLFLTKFLIPVAHGRPGLPNAELLLSIHPDEPIVSAGGTTFLEMDRYESPAFKKRFYYLEDRDAAIKYAHSTLFAGYDQLPKYFPIESTIEPLDTFEKQHRQFLVLDRPNFPENWLMAKLKDGGAKVQEIGKYDFPYEDRWVYQVTLPEQGNARE